MSQPESITSAGQAPALLWGERILLVLGLVLMAAPQLGRVDWTDANGYAAAAHALVLGQWPYAQVLHTHNPLFLVVGALFYVLTGGWTLAFNASALCLSAVAMGVFHAAASRWLASPWARVGVVAALFYSPITMVAATRFIGLDELLLGLAITLWSLWGTEKPRPLLAGLGLAVALASKWMALPWAAGLLLAAFLLNRRLSVVMLLWMIAFWLLFTGWSWLPAGPGPWWLQAGLVHGGKRAQIHGVDVLLKNAALMLAPALWLAIWRWKTAPAPVKGFAVLSIAAWGFGLTQHPFLAYYYLLPPLAALVWLGVAGGVVGASMSPQKTLLWVAPALAVALWQGVMTVQTLDQPHAPPGFDAMCAQVRRVVARNAPAFVDSPLLFPVLRCTGTQLWGGMADNNLYVFDRVVNPQTMMANLQNAPPAVVVLTRGHRLGRVPVFLKFLDKRFVEQPQPPGSVLRVWLSKEGGGED